jgi:hypothetical protein
MRETLCPLRFLLLLFAGLVNHQQAKVVDQLREENRVASRDVTACCRAPETTPPRAIPTSGRVRN